MLGLLRDGTVTGQGPPRRSEPAQVLLLPARPVRAKELGDCPTERLKAALNALAD